MNTVSVSADGRYSQRRDSLVRKLSVALGRTEGGTSQALYGPDSLPNKVERLLWQLCRFGAVELAHKIVRRFQQIVTERQVIRLDIATKVQAQQADAVEEVDELAYELDPSDANLERLIRSTEKQGLTSLAKCDALRAEQRRREQGKRA